MPLSDRGSPGKMSTAQWLSRLRYTCGLSGGLIVCQALFTPAQIEQDVAHSLASFSIPSQKIQDFNTFVIAFALL